MPEASTAIASLKFGVTVVALVVATVVLASGRTKSPNVFLAAFLLLIAGSYALDAFITIYGVAHPSYLDVFQVQMVFNVMDPIVLLYLVSVFPQRRGWSTGKVFVPVGVVAAALLFRVVTNPSEFLWDFTWMDTLLSDSFLNYPPFRLIYNLYVVGTYGTAFFVLVRSFARETVATKVAELRPLVFAFGVALLPQIVNVVEDTLNPADVTGRLLFGLRTVATNSAFNLALSLSLLFVAYFVVRRVHAREGSQDRFRSVMPAVTAVAAVLVSVNPFWGVTNDLGLLQRDLAAGLNVVATAIQPIRWLVFSGILGYALLDRQLFDFRRRARTSLAAAIVVLVAGAGWMVGLVVASVFQDDPLGSSPLVLGATVVGAATALGARPLAARLAARAFPRADDPQFLHERKVEVFRHALAEARQAGRDPVSDRQIVAFRRSLGLSEAAHLALLEAPPPDATPGPVLPGSLLFSRYEILEILGSGASGRTWRARDVVLERQVAVKHVFGRPREEGGDAVAAYVREARAAGSLSHRNLVAVLDARPAGSDAFLVMEYVDGGTLAERLAREPLAQEEVARVVDGVLAGLEAVHAKGILHRDVKPANVLLTADGTPKLADFGVARIPGLDATVTRLSGGHPGTPRYMAPEQVGGLPLGPAADLYAVGVLAIEALNGKPAGVRPGSVEDVMRELARAPCSPEMRAVLAKALAPRPEDRWADAAEFRRALGRANAGT